jgi:hypothetical protein
MPAPAALLDECLDPALAAMLKERGFDVVSLQAVEARGVSDPQVLGRAVELGRVLITQNTAHFKRVHVSYLQQGQRHPGIICLPQRGTLQRRALRAAMMLDWIATQEHASRLFVWGELQQLLERGFRMPDYDAEDVQRAIGRA